MEISEVRVKLVNDSTDRLKAYCSMTIEGCFVIRDLKVIDGTNGLFVAMPSRKLAARCGGCGSKNHLRAKFCNECGHRLDEGRKPRALRSKLHADIAHPINAECRQFIQTRIIEEYEAELERAQDPDYQGSAYDEDYDDDISPYEELVRELKSGQGPPREQMPVAEPAAPAGRPPEPRPSPLAGVKAKPQPARQTHGEDFGAGLL